MRLALFCGVAAAVAGAWPALATRRWSAFTARLGNASDDWAGILVGRALDALAGRKPADQVGALCGAMCSELRAGAAPEAALLAATAANHVARRARAAAALGEPVAQALLEDARAARSPGLAGVAACWSAAADSGAGLAEGLERVAELSRAQRRIAADLEAETAGPRATARVLMMLPLFGLVIGELLGAHPIAWLLGSRIGWLCFGAGVGCLAAGSLWTRRIIASAQPSARSAPP